MPGRWGDVGVVSAGGVVVGGHDGAHFDGRASLHSSVAPINGVAARWEENEGNDGIDHLVGTVCPQTLTNLEKGLSKLRKNTERTEPSTPLFAFPPHLNPSFSEQLPPLTLTFSRTLVRLSKRVKDDAVSSSSGQHLR